MSIFLGEEPAKRMSEWHSWKMHWVPLRHSTKIRVFSTEVGDCRAVSGIPTLETVVKTDNNPLTYIMATPNLDSTWHHWIESLVGLTLSIEYHKGQNNAAADALSWVTSRLEAETMKSMLYRITMGTLGRADAHDPVVVEAGEEIHMQVWESAVQAKTNHVHVNLHVTGWLLNRKIQYLGLWLSGFTTRKDRIWSFC